jgi:uncharacterized protein YjbJ (UPF0337 family)
MCLRKDHNRHHEIRQEETMKSSTTDQAEGTFHEVRGKIKEMAGTVSRNPALEGQGTDEKTAGKIQEKIGEIEKVVGK